MGNSSTTARPDDPQSTLTAGETLSDYDENIINRGTIGRPKPLLKFHSVCGTNIQLLREGRVARRKESFCKGLAFSNRPISIDEIVCIRLSEIGTNWSGVMRFGVTNVDPASFRDIELPKFACPDLTSKGGYWAKSLAERYSVEGSILHFFTNANGEMYYGVNGVHKGLFLSGINVLSPLWIIVDIYGNSIAVEFIDPSEVQLQSKRTSSKNRAGLTGSARGAIQPPSTESAESSPAPSSLVTHHQSVASMTPSISANNLLNVTTNSPRSSSSRASPMANVSKLRFHNTKGVNVYLQHDETVAVRKHGEYYHGYVFTERPIKVGEKLVILVSQVEDSFSGSLAFGLTSCDPSKVLASRLPVDSDELLERTEYWVCIKDVAATPQVGDTLSFQVDAEGRVIFSKNDAPSRVIMHVDISIPLWAFFDLYGSTRKIQILDLVTPLSARNISDLSRSYRASSEGAPANVAEAKAKSNRPMSTNWSADSLRVALPPGCSSSASRHGHSSAIAIPPSAECAVVPASSSSNPIVPSAPSATSSSAPSSTTPPFSSYSSIVDPAELAQIRANIALRRINRNSDISTGESVAQTSSATAGSSATTSTNVDLAPGRSPPTLNELLANRRIQLEARMAALTILRDNQSPIREDSSAYSQRNQWHFSSALDTPNTTISGASVTAPLLPPPLFSLGVSAERSNRPMRRRNLSDLSSSSDSSPTGRLEAAENSEQQLQNSGNGDEQQGSECSICMNNRVNAVIYRCGHMCMCFPCAKETHRRSGDCPICRTPIIDVIRCYPV
ncbi:hypothetical protein niasHS_007496 [Heterodera schachtii]|uniref:Neuralized n=1 Tax=Heterodera schachtii TaxID=97005 RepID=A0ABD2JXR2_HETSC